MQYHPGNYQSATHFSISRQSSALIVNILLLAILPALSLAVEHHLIHAQITTTLFGKWVIFWVVGIRLLVEGFTQVINRRNTGGMFSANRNDSGEFRKITGLAKMALAGMGFLCVVNDQWSLLAAITVGVYIGIAGIQHDFKKPATINEWISMLYDCTVFVIIAACLVF